MYNAAINNVAAQNEIAIYLFIYAMHSTPPKKQIKRFEGYVISYRNTTNLCDDDVPSTLCFSSPCIYICKACQDHPDPWMTVTCIVFSYKAMRIRVLKSKLLN